MKDRFKRAPGTKGRTKAKRPDAARGKTTRKGKIKKIMKEKISDALKRQVKTLGPVAGAGIAGAGIRRLMEKGPRKVPNPRGEGTRMETGPRKMPDPRGRGTRMDKGPRKMTPLAAASPARKKTNGRRGNMVENFRKNRKVGGRGR